MYRLIGLLLCFCLQASASCVYVRGFGGANYVRDTELGRVYGGAVGCKVLIGRLEVEGSWRHNDFSDETLGEMTSYAALVNAFLETPIPGFISTYVGVGVGQLWERVNGSTTKGRAYQAIGGVALKPLPLSSVSVEYHYLTGEGLFHNHSLAVSIAQKF